VFTVNGPASASRDSSVDAAAVRRQVEAILASQGFESAGRRGRLLKYLVEKALAGEPVKEYGIGVDVYEKPPDYDPRLDPSVRVEIGRLRAKLAAYYSFAGADAAIRIEIPKGSYVPVFETPSAEPCPAPPRQPRPAKRPAKWVLAAAAILVSLSAVLLWRFFPRETAIDSVMVLPFQNLTGDPHNDYLADGVTEDLTDALAQVSSLRVVARTSAFQFKGRSADIREIGRKANAEAVIEGSVSIVDGKLRLTVQVNRSRDGYHIFSRAFEGGPHDLARLENKMAAPVLAVIRPQAAIAKRTAPDPEAYDLFLKARAYRGDGTRASSDQALAYLHEAIKHDPKFADAYAAMASVYASDAVNISPAPVEYANQAKAAASKALELNPDSGVAYATLGVMDSTVLLDWKRGEQELRKSIALMPQDALGHNRLGVVLMAQGRFSEAIPELRQAASLDPLVPAPHATLGLAYFLSRDYEESLRLFREARDLYPDALIIHAFIGLALEGTGRLDQAMEEYKTVQAKMPAFARPFLAHLLAVTGKRKEALVLLDQLEHPSAELPNAFDVAAVYAGLGDKDAAFEWLERAYQRRIIWFLKVHPFLDPLRRDPRYSALLHKSGLD
jgi:TolB-like protein